MKRITWSVRPAGRFGWSVVRDNKFETRFLLKFRAVAFARWHCRFEWEHYHFPSELMIADRKGRYTEAGSTYGADPRSSEG